MSAFKRVKPVLGPNGGPTNRHTFTSRRCGLLHNANDQAQPYLRFAASELVRDNHMKGVSAPQAWFWEVNTRAVTGLGTSGPHGAKEGGLLLTTGWSHADGVLGYGENLLALFRAFADVVTATDRHARIHTKPRRPARGQRPEHHPGPGSQGLRRHRPDGGAARPAAAAAAAEARGRHSPRRPRYRRLSPAQASASRTYLAGKGHGLVKLDDLAVALAGHRSPGGCRADEKTLIGLTEGNSGPAVADPGLAELFGDEFAAVSSVLARCAPDNDVPAAALGTLGRWDALVDQRLRADRARS